MTLTLTRSERIHYQALRKELIDAHTYVRANGNRSTDTVALLIDRVGLDAAKDIVALMICCKGTWDERISRRNRIWADIRMPSGDDIYHSDTGIYYCDEIHPCHMDAIANSIREM